MAISSTATPLSIERWRTSACASDTSGASPASRAGGVEGAGGRLALEPALDRGEQLVAAPVERLRRQAADLLEPVAVGRARGAPAPSAPGRGARSPPAGPSRSAISSRHSTSSRATARPLAQARRAAAAARTRVPASRSSVDLLERAALLARPLEPPLLVEPLLEALAEREQAAGVVGGVLELLRGERARSQRGEALGALQPRAEHLAHQRLVALLAAEPEEARGHLRVEHVA